MWQVFTAAASKFTLLAAAFFEACLIEENDALVRARFWHGTRV